MIKKKGRSKKTLSYDFPEASNINLQVSPEEALIWLTRAMRLTWEATDEKTHKIYDLQWRGEL